MTEPNERDPAAIVQSAALEAIKAFRSFLDVAEGVVRDPQQAVVVGKAFADAARSMFDQQGEPADEPAQGDQGARPRVRRIHVD
jgi:hypothetical protein